MPQALERASWPQTKTDTATGQQYQLAQNDNSVTNTMHELSLNGYGCTPSRLSLQLYQPQHPTTQLVPQPAQLHTASIGRYPSLDSALALQPCQPTFAIPAFLPQRPAQLPVFGEQFVAASMMEIFYIRERPSKPQPGDGVIKTPVIDHPGKFQDGFKVDMTEHLISFQRVLRDLPDKQVVCCQRKKVRL